MIDYSKFQNLTDKGNVCRAKAIALCEVVMLSVILAYSDHLVLSVSFVVFHLDHNLTYQP